VFQPQIVEYYANKDYEKAKNETIKSMKISGIFGNIPFCYIVIFGSYFCSLWMPTIELKLLSILCIITFINVFTGGLILPLYNIFTICNKTKWNAFLNIGSGFISFVLVLIILKFTNLGVYAIVGVSAIVGLLNGFILVPLFASKSLNVKLSSFYGAIF
jgi:Na+-driven multidrug efflux pump